MSRWDMRRVVEGTMLGLANFLLTRRLSLGSMVSLLKNGRRNRLENWVVVLSLLLTSAARAKGTERDETWFIFICHRKHKRHKRVRSSFCVFVTFVAIKF